MNKMIYLYQLLPQAFSGRIRVLTCILFSFLATMSLSAQVCITGTEEVLAKWTFAGNAPNCPGQNIGEYGKQYPLFQLDKFFYCPDESAGCGDAVIGSRGHGNTGWFRNAICGLNFYNPSKATTHPYYNGVNFDVNATTWDPNNPANFYVRYSIPQGELGCITEFSVKFIQKQYRGSPGFRTQGFA
ncbi:MAG: hypothetical protein D6772_13905, partial [Bacteroidetes bacterium]